MPSPEIQRTGGAIIFQWPDYNLSIRLDRFRDARNGGAFAEFVASTSAPGYAPHLTQAQLNLTAMRTRTEFVKRLSALYQEANWDEVIETVCAWGLRLYREGEPVLQLTRNAQVEPPQLCLDPLLYDRLPTVLYGPGGIAKSYLALFYAMLMYHGGSLAGFIGTAQPTLFLDFESDYGDHVHRANRLALGHPELTTATPYYRRSALPLADDLTAISRIVSEYGIKVLIVDSLAAACGGDLERPETAIRLFSALRSLRVASLLIAHVPKNAEEKTIYGSVFFSNFPRSTWEMKRVQDTDDTVTRIGLFHRKCNLASLHRPLGLRLTFAEGVHIDPLELSNEPDLAVGLPLKDRMKTALGSAAKTAKDLADELAVPLGQIKNQLTHGKGSWVTPLDQVGKEFRWGLLSPRT